MTLAANAAYGLDASAANCLATVTIADNDPVGWHNTVLAEDVNNDGQVTPVDVLLLVSRINSAGAGVLPTTPNSPPYYDVNGDGSLSPLDILQVISYLNSHS